MPKYRVIDAERPQSLSHVNVTIEKGIVFDKDPGIGIKVDPLNPTYGWRDLLGDLSYKAVGAGSPTLGALVGGLATVAFFALNDKTTVTFHVPHDYVPGTDMFLHLHWTHEGKTISGSLVCTYGVTYAKGHNQATFPLEIAIVQTILTPDLATIPDLKHRLDEFQLSATNPSATQLDSTLLEPDGLIIVGVKTTTIPVITGGAINKPALLFLDIHYQSTGINTKNKAPNFYT